MRSLQAVLRVSVSYSALMAGAVAIGLGAMLPAVTARADNIPTWSATCGTWTAVETNGQGVPLANGQTAGPSGSINLPAAGVTTNYNVT